MILTASKIFKYIDLLILGFDITIATFFIISTAGVNSYFYFLYFLIILNANIKYDTLVSLSLTVICIIICFCIIFYSNKLYISYEKNNQIFIILSLITFAMTFEWTRTFKKKTQSLNIKIAGKNEILKNINIDLDNQKKALAEKNKHYLNTLGFVSHELKNPITNINSLSDYLSMDEEISPEERKEIAGVINNSAKNMINMIHKFLSLAKIEKGALTIDYRQLEIFNDILVPVIADLQIPAKEKHMHIIKDPNSNVNTLITWSDHELLKVIFSNLIGNAIKYGYPNTNIRYKVKLIDNIITCSIINYGDGIPKDKLNLVFEKFERLDNTKDSVRGSGLGLFNTKEMIKKLNGNIWCESAPKHTTTFTFTLPLIKGDDIYE
jgi:signal transduction histidine kinase